MAFAAMAFLTLIALAGGALALIKTKVANDAAKNAETQRADAEEAKARATDRAKAAEDATLRAVKANAGEQVAKKLAEEKTERAWELIDYMRGPLQATLKNKGGSTVLQEVRKLRNDYYAKERVDESDAKQLIRRWEDAIRDGDEDMADANSHVIYLENAEKSYENALAIARELLKRDVLNHDWRFRLSVSLAKLGDVQMAREEFQGATISYGEALQIRRELVERDAKNKGWLIGLALSLEKLGDLEMRQSQKVDPEIGKSKLLSAAEKYKESQEILQQMSAADPDDSVSQLALGIGFGKVGSNQKARGDFGGALASYGQAVTIFGELAKRSPGSPDLQSELSKGFDQMGRIEQERGNSGAAVQNFQQASNMHRQLLRADPENIGLQMELGVILGRLGFSQNEQGDFLNAEENYTKAVGMLDGLNKTGKLPENLAKILEMSRENLERVRNKRRTEKK